MPITLGQCNNATKQHSGEQFVESDLFGYAEKAERVVLQDVRTGVVHNEVGVKLFQGLRQGPGTWKKKKTVSFVNNLTHRIKTDLSLQHLSAAYVENCFLQSAACFNNFKTLEGN